MECTTTPRRVQRTRRRGEPGMPPGAKYIGRGSRHGNRFKVGEPLPWPYSARFDEPVLIADRQMAVLWYALDLKATVGALYLACRDLAGHDLACWCAEGDLCHGDVLLPVTNAPEDSAEQMLDIVISVLAYGREFPYGPA
ncbi:DUF4326 domain-containing protein [Actinopolymorpha sp. B17G11]|uniref:DUF4326 domain-containing protein n=1 Tax=Actinopolymorpha sp. B17G11 TaxID=3160861 RepID=UPI0032E4343F